MNKILKIFFFNFLLFFSFILILELIFGSWLKKQNWGNTLRSERLKKISYSVKFKENTYTTKELNGNEYQTTHWNRI